MILFEVHEIDPMPPNSIFCGRVGLRESVRIAAGGRKYVEVLW